MAKKSTQCDHAPDGPRDAIESSEEAEANEPVEDTPEDGEVEAPKQKPKKNRHLWRNGKLYDSQRGVTCHWCRQKTVQDRQVTCTQPSCRLGQRGRTKLPNTFCGPCLRNRHGEDAAACAATGSWVCPPCRVSCGPGCPTCCNCGFCRAKANLPATGKALHHAHKAGFTNVHDWLVHLETGESADAIAARKTQHKWGAIAIPPESTTEPGAQQDAPCTDLSSPCVVSASDELGEEVAEEEQGAAAATCAASDSMAAGAKKGRAREAGQGGAAAVAATASDKVAAGAEEARAGQRGDSAGRAEGGEGTVGAADAAGKAPSTGEGGGSEGAEAANDAAGACVAPHTDGGGAEGREGACTAGDAAGRAGMAPTTGEEEEAGGSEGAVGAAGSLGRDSSMAAAATAAKDAAAAELGSVPVLCDHHSSVACTTALATPKGAPEGQCRASSAAPGAPHAKSRKRAAGQDAWDAALAGAGCEDVPSPIKRCRLADVVEDQQGGGVHKQRRAARAEAGPPAQRVELSGPPGGSAAAAVDGPSIPNGDSPQGACCPSKPAAIDLPTQEGGHGAASDKSARLRAALAGFQSSQQQLRSRQQQHQSKVDALVREHASLVEESKGLAEDVAALEREHTRLLALYDELSRCEVE